MTEDQDQRRAASERVYFESLERADPFRHVHANLKAVERLLKQWAADRKAKEANHLTDRNHEQE